MDEVTRAIKHKLTLLKERVALRLVTARQWLVAGREYFIVSGVTAAVFLLILWMVW